MISFDSSYQGIRFIRKVWHLRGEFNHIEAMGFGQFYYNALSAHLEQVLSKLVRLRLSYLGGPGPLGLGRKATGLEHTPPFLAETVTSVANALDAEAGNAPLNKLTELYRRVFGKSMVQALGKDLENDLRVIGALRNLFAHGRQITIDTGEIEPVQGPDGSLKMGSTAIGDLPLDAIESQALREAGKRLVALGLSKKASPDVWLELMFDDDIMLHFYRATQAVEAALIGPPFLRAGQSFRSNSNGLEGNEEMMRVVINRLPDLETWLKPESEPLTDLSKLKNPFE